MTAQPLKKLFLRTRANLYTDREKQMNTVTNCFYRTIAALLVVAGLSLADCGNPAAEPEGHPFVFENNSSVEISVRPDPDHPGQGWDAFNLGPGESKTVYSLLSYYDPPDAHAIFFLCRETGAAGQVEEPLMEVAEGEPGRITFNNVETKPTTGTVRILNDSSSDITYFKLVYTDGFSGWEWMPSPGVAWGYNDMNPLRDIRPGEFYLWIRDSSGTEIQSGNFTLSAGETLDLAYNGEFIAVIIWPDEEE
ncbi:MAG: hypothetical protein LBU21_10520 [Treponema sp.]|jgi:hypothetical protein|nr:hypothetical protein [Treponema sp.]